jgi:hypothetical protein
MSLTSAKVSFSIAPAALRPLARMVHEMSEMLAGDERASRHAVLPAADALDRVIVGASNSELRARGAYDVTHTDFAVVSGRAFASKS